LDDEYVPLGGAAVPADELTLVKARDLALRLVEGGIGHAVLAECRRSDGSETVVFDVHLEVPNRRVHSIKRRERIAATFYDGDRLVPKVEALRKGFPVVPHLNLHVQEFPRSLCLYNERYDELKRQWTAPRFVHRIREWLELNARGELHPEDQGLEPLLVDFAGHIVLPHDLAAGQVQQLFVTGDAPEGRRWFLLAHQRPPTDGRRALQFVASVHHCLPQTHGVIHRCPGTLADVAELTRAAGLDLIEDLRQALPAWSEESKNAKVILVLVFPKRRTDAGPVEDYDTFCFATAHSVRQLGVQIGIWEEMNGSLATLIEVDREKRGQDVPVLVLNPCFELTRADLSRLNGRPEGRNDVKVAGIGVGALGSQVVTNLSRSGFGRWTLIDPDRLMPHNLARHALDGRLVGWNKAVAVACVVGTFSCEDGALVGSDADVLLGPDEVRAALSSSDVILDMTASVAVQRHLARDVDSQARRVCTFLTPSGADVVVLAEDVGRQATVDALEMQYYRALLHEDGLSGHLESDRVQQRYARSCGDLTSAMPHDLVALHSAIASRSIENVIAEAPAFIGVWRADANREVRRVPVEVRRVTEFSLGRWTVVLDDGLRDRLHRFRDEKLPSETGGVLLGSFDSEREVLYVVDTLPSPPDSEERRDLYIRGCEGLREAVRTVETKTAGMLEYIGEWHSHPRNSSTRPSDFDRKAFDWLTALMSKDGLPAIMMIAGDEELSLFVGSMGADEAPIPEDPRGEVA
jgi:integrative and conjugative element protein (TIGR02256 family)